MSKLGEFLEAVYGVRDRFTTVRATLRHWQDRLYAEVASDNEWARLSEVGTMLNFSPLPPRVGGWTGEDGPRECESELKVWFAARDRGREEVRSITGKHSGPQVVIANGVRSWCDTAGTARWRTVDLDGGSLSLARHFNRYLIRQLLAYFDLEEVGTVRAAGCECIRVRALLVRHLRPELHWFPRGGDEYELHADPERGTILAVVARVEQAVFETNEVVEVAYDEPLDDSLFTIPVPETSRGSKTSRRNPRRS